MSLNTRTIVLGQSERALYRAEGYEAFFASPAAKELLDSISQRLRQVDIVTFDVFDTVLLRDGKSELERFHDIATRFVEMLGGKAPKLSPRTCLMARIHSASTAYRLSPRKQDCVEGRLADIALNTVRSLKLDPAYADIWIEAELGVESEQLRLSSFVLELMALAEAENKRTIFISDMYLDRDNIAILLAKAGLADTPLANIISSADEILNKRSGTIFPALAERYGLEGGRFLHLGDSFQSDYLMPKSCGWLAQHLPVPKVLLASRYESHHRTVQSLFGMKQFPLPMSRPAPR